MWEGGCNGDSGLSSCWRYWRRVPALSVVYVLLVVALVAPCPPGLLHDVVGSTALLWWALSVVPCLAGAVWLLALVPLVVVDGGASVLVGGCGPPVVWLAVPVGPLVWMVLEVAVSVVLFWDGVCCGGAIQVLSDVVVCPSVMFMIFGDWALAPPGGPGAHAQMGVVACRQCVRCRMLTRPSGQRLFCSRGCCVSCRVRTRPSRRRLFPSWQGLDSLPDVQVSIQTAAGGSWVLPGRQ